MQLFDLTGKVAIVTGSSRGIGRAIAEGLAAAGAKVVVSSRTQADCDIVATAIREDGGKALGIAANISRHDDLVRLVSSTRDVWGKIDILVCNAASNPYFGPASGLGDDVFDKVMRNNVLSSIWLCNLVAPEMLERRDGAIVLVSSISGLQGEPNIGTYGLSKAADMALARNLAMEYGPNNVRINCIAPGLIQTDFSRALYENPALRAEYEAKTPLRRLGLPQDIAGIAVMLASRAGAFVTGQTIVADGGYRVV
ncbi:MAG: SDR family oxidoreductase [Mesorhizobium sp.]|uniref:SDR family NAD(P)-dependent oxidoreductase n=1 Tax=Mesorhizobium sp. TaxID=1871066 RepID=UPI000FEA1F33|nr:SDR family oxidoreductase [Mesorhizobium sp.]RWI54738.1 MAG: SDR family oxidoreductase [Mesorhizobium sp.]